MNPRRRARLRRRRHLRAWVKTWVHWAPWDWAEAWKECAATGCLHPLDFYTAECIRGWRRWGVRAGLAAYRQGRRP